jgi:N-dimethylarginine dimethylaminohydrolase
MFMADVFVMTPSGAIIGRPASEVRAGEERWAARAIAAQGMPIVRGVGGDGTFEGADLMWLNPKLALVARGLRTNDAAFAQIKSTQDPDALRLSGHTGILRAPRFRVRHRWH